MNFLYFRPFFKAKEAFFSLHSTNLTTFALWNVPNLSKNRLIKWIDSSKKCIGTCIMGKFSKMNRFMVLESQNRLSTSLILPWYYTLTLSPEWIMTHLRNEDRTGEDFPSRQQSICPVTQSIDWPVSSSPPRSRLPCSAHLSLDRDWFPLHQPWLHSDRPFLRRWCQSVSFPVEVHLIWDVAPVVLCQRQCREPRRLKSCVKRRIFWLSFRAVKDNADCCACLFAILSPYRAGIKTGP